MENRAETDRRREEAQICTRCILPSSFPGISFDADGVCNYCRKHRGESAQLALKERYEKKFLRLLEGNRGESYDVLMAYSGGKDSTYTLDLFVNRYRLRVLALTFDNAFISRQSFDNIRTVCEAVGADSMIVGPNPALLKKIFSVAAKRDLYSPKTLERASTICTSCIGLVKSILLRTALEKRIPFVGYGWSPGQAPVQASVMRTNAALMRSTQQAIFEPLAGIVGREAILPYFVTEEQFSGPDLFPWNVHPLAFVEYDEEKILARNRELGWVKPDDTDPNSTNCLLNAYANHVHQARHGFHPYVWEIANMVRAGVLSREEGITKIYSEENEALVQSAAVRLGV